MEVPTQNITMEPARTKRPMRSAKRLEDSLSASQPQIGDATSRAAPYVAKSMDTQCCTVQPLAKSAQLTGGAGLQ